MIWRKNFDIKRVDLNIAAETMPGFSSELIYTIGKPTLTKGILIIENLDNTNTYFPRNELRTTIKKILYTIIHNPARVDRVHRETTQLNQRYFRVGKKIRMLDLRSMSDKELLRWHAELYQLQFVSHCRSLATTWFVDSDGEDFSNYMLRLVRQRIRARKLTINPAHVFSVLTTPARASMGGQEEQESLAIVDWINRRHELRQWFMSHTTQQLVDQFSSLPESVQKRLHTHFEQWCWTPYTYIGPAYDLAYYLEVWRGLLHEGIDAQKEIAEKKKKARAIQRERKHLIQTLGLSPREQHTFDIAAEIVWLKGFRKDCYYHGFFVLDLLLAEIARRTGLSLLQAKYLLPDELPRVLAGEDFSDLANARMKFCVLVYERKQLRILVGAKARVFLKKQKFEKVVVKQVHEMKGTCACPGSACGTVKIINIPEDMGKMKQGDIMVAHTTFPALVPAMKKAAAIVTEDGGVTCHAAIVARELQTPCVVGCKNILQILHDGDIIELDAEKGIIKKIG